jgi:hypothetical protein
VSNPDPDQGDDTGDEERTHPRPVQSIRSPGRPPLVGITRPAPAGMLGR